MARTLDYKSAFDVIGPIMVGPSSSHTAGAVRIGSVARQVLKSQPEKIEVTYYESFAETHSGHGTDLAIVGGILDFPPEDSRVKNSVNIAKEEGIEITFIEKEGTSLGEHPNCALIKLDSKEKHVEVLGISIGGGTIKIKSIHVNGACIVMNHTLPILLMYGNNDIAKFNHCINEMVEEGLLVNEEIKSTYKEHLLIALHLHRPIEAKTLNKMKMKYKDIDFSNLI